ncbi:MAG TPA: trehalose-phosphatase [Bryobacteraceae bacterium]|jgi:trehalose-phosphatase
MLSYLTDIVVDVQERLQAAERIFLFLDFDGTLAPIEADFAVPKLDPGSRETLALLASQPAVVTTIISGRAAEDLFSRIRLKGLIYAGNHGLEIFGRSLRFVEPLAARRQARLEDLSNDVSVRLRPIAGAIVEFKGLTASVHYRQAAEPDHAEIHAAVRMAAGAEAGLFRLIHGHKVIEILPCTNWHKGAAAAWIIHRLGGDNALTIYLGDDAGDEKAFQVLTDAVTIKVGAQPSCAEYRLPHPAAVHEFLRWLATRSAQPAEGLKP